MPLGRVRAATVYRYEGPLRHSTPVLLVPNLGIAPPFILDLLPGRSLIEYLVGQGFDVYLLDWGVGADGGSSPTFDDAVGAILPRACRRVAAYANADAISVVAYCMGAALVLASFASAPSCRLPSLVTMAGPVDFARAGSFTRWVDRRYFDVDRIVDVLGCAPALLFQVARAMLRPTMGVSFMLDLLTHLHEPRRVEELMAVARWVREFVPVPGEFFRSWIRLFYQDNRLYRGTLQVGEYRARLQTVRCPVLVLAAHEDPIAPPASAQWTHAVPAISSSFALNAAHTSACASSQSSLRSFGSCAITSWASPGEICSFSAANTASVIHRASRVDGSSPSWTTRS